MQKFSYLQRNFSNQSYISSVILAIIFIAYTNLTILSPWFLPLFGVASIAIYRINSRSLFIAILIAALFFEYNHSLIMLSSWLFFFIFAKYIIPILESMIDCKRCLNTFGAMLAYILFFGANIFFSILTSGQYIGYSFWVIAYWMIAEATLSAFIFNAH